MSDALALGTKTPAKTNPGTFTTQYVTVWNAYVPLALTEAVVAHLKALGHNVKARGNTIQVAWSSDDATEISRIRTEIDAWLADDAKDIPVSDSEILSYIQEYYA